MKLPTNAEVYDRGEQIEDWPCDVEGSNESIEHIVSFCGRRYSIITDWEGNIRNAQKIARPIPE